MRIGTKLLMGFIPLAILTAMVAEVLYINSKWISESSQTVREVYQNYEDILEMRKHEKNYIFYREKFYLYRMKDLAGKLTEFLSRQQRLGGEVEMIRGFNNAQKILTQYQSMIDQLLAAEERSKAEEQNIKEMTALGHQLERLGGQMVNVAWIPIQVGTRKARTYSTVFAIQAALIGVVLAFYLSRLLVKPIQQLVRGTKKVAAGVFTERVQIRSRDEIGELAESFNQMVVSLEQGQARLQQSSQELRETKETLENIVQSSVDAIVATDPKGRITFANRSMQEMLLGQAGQEDKLLGVSMSQLYSGGMTEARKIMTVLREQGRLLNYETTIVSNGKMIPILTSASLLKDERGIVVGTLGVIKNLTEKKKLEEDLKKAQAELGQKERLAAIGRLASGVAHEMNDPLTSILTFSNLLREETQEGDANRESLEIIIKEATRARRIVSDLLSFSREAKPALEWIDLNDVLTMSLLLLEKQGALEKIDVQIDQAKELPLVRADSGQMQQVFTNLLLNATQGLEALDAGAEKLGGPPPGKKLLIRTQYLEAQEESLSAHRPPTAPFIRVVVEDNGCGISPENLSKVFDPFYTTKITGEGTGLGLYIVSGILKNYGAQYHLESKEGQGTTFTIDFPLTESEKN
ncbi:MAG: ATP-binding protein [Deltaproteobacteria bacterium]|nr:ATP-binding protein [Deltaproteobacteria bacterium]